MYVIAYCLEDDEFIEVITGRTEDDVIFGLADLMQDSDVEDMTLKEAFDYVETWAADNLGFISITIVDPAGKIIFKI